MKISTFALVSILLLVFMLGNASGVGATYAWEWKALADIRAETLSKRTENENLVATRAKLEGEIKEKEAKARQTREKIYAANPKVDQWRKSVVPELMSERVRNAAKAHNAGASKAGSNSKEPKG